MKNNKIVTILILLPLTLVAVFFYLQGQNSKTATLELLKPKISENIPIDDSKWYKIAYQNAPSDLKKEIQKTPLNVSSDINNEKAYKVIYDKAIAANNLLIAAFAKEKIADLSKSDSHYLDAGNLFMEQSTITGDEESKVFLLAKSKQLYTKAVEANPNSIIANNSLAVAIIQLGQDPPMVGIAYIKKSLAIDSNDYGTNYLYGQLLLMSTQYEKAIKVYNKLVNLQPSNAGLHFTLSDIYGKVGNPEKAKEYLEKAKTLNNK